MQKQPIINQELRDLLPPLSPEQLEKLEEEIVRDGCTSPLTLWNDILIDGHNRYTICTRRKIPYQTIQMEFSSIDDVKLWMWQHQDNRRSLSTFGRIEFVLKLKQVVVAKAKERQRGGQGGILLRQNSAEAKETRQELAKLARSSHDTIERVEYILAHADKDTINALRWDKKGTSINKVFNNLKAASKGKQSKKTQSATSSETTETPQSQESHRCDSESMPESDTASGVTPYPGEKPGFAPGSDEELKYSSKTQLKPIPRNRPDILVRNLLSHFPKEFVPNMIRATFEILVEVGEKKQAKALAQEIYQAFGRK